VLSYEEHVLDTQTSR